MKTCKQCGVEFEQTHGRQAYCPRHAWKRRHQTHALKPHGLKRTERIKQWLAVLNDPLR